MKPYLGVYGLYVKDSQILVIKKSRGPYTGQFDLPGGGIEFNETIHDCLSREITEETGCTLLRGKFISIKEYFCEYRKNRTMAKFHHLGIYYLVDLDTKNLKTSPDGQDSLGAVFIDLDKINKTNTSPIVYLVIKDFIKNKKRQSP